jgi:hypothetical protein
MISVSYQTSLQENETQESRTFCQESLYYCDPWNTPAMDTQKKVRYLCSSNSVLQGSYNVHVQPSSQQPKGCDAAEIILHMILFRGPPRCLLMVR